MNDLLEVAKLGRSVGLKGFLKLHDRSDFASQFKKGASFFDESGKSYTIKEIDKANQLVLLENFESLELAKTLVNKTLYQSIENTRLHCKLKKGEYFYFDILECECFENELKLGVIVDILETSASHLLLIKTDEKLTQKGLAKEFYLPYEKYFVLNVKLEQKRLECAHALELLQSL